MKNSHPRMLETVADSSTQGLQFESNCIIGETSEVKLKSAAVRAKEIVTSCLTPSLRAPGTILLPALA